MSVRDEMAAPHIARHIRPAVPRAATVIEKFALRPGIIVIGASTGGPQALVALLARLTPVLPLVPICVTLHMPRDMMPIVASHVARRCAVDTKVLDAPGQLSNGVIFFAPGDKHLDFNRTPEGVEITLSAAKSRNYCKPAVDAMFGGAARAFGARAIGVVLSGMGEDGLEGARLMHAAGGTLLVQDKTTSAVWGMPGAVAKAGLAAAVLRPEAIASEIIRRLRTSGAAR